MNLKSFVSQLISRKKITYAFDRVRPDGQIVPLTAGESEIRCLLITPHELTIRPFDTPTASKPQIQRILANSLMPYDPDGSLAVFPCITHREGRSAHGIAFCATGANLPVQNSRCLPAQLVLGGALPSGTGVTLWKDEEGISSMLWDEGTPTLTRWNAGGEIEDVIDWYKVWNERHGYSSSPEYYCYDATNPELLATGELDVIANATLSKFDWIEGLDMSRSAVQSALRLEETVNSASNYLAWACALLALMLAGHAVINWHEGRKAEAMTARMTDFYRKTFEPERKGAVSNPVGLAREFLAAPSTESKGRPFTEVMSGLASIMHRTSSLDISLDTVRYNEAGIDITGTAPDMSSVLTFRSEWEAEGLTARADNTQYVNGIGYRFDVRVRWPE